MENCPDGYVWRKPHTRTSHKGVVSNIKGKCVKGTPAKRKSPKPRKIGVVVKCPPGKTFIPAHYRPLASGGTKFYPAKCYNKAPGAKRSPRSPGKSPRKSQCPPGTVWRKAYTRKTGVRVAGQCVKKRSPSGSPKAPKVRSPRSFHECPQGSVWRKPHVRVSHKGVSTAVKGKCVKKSVRKPKSPSLLYRVD